LVIFLLWKGIARKFLLLWLHWTALIVGGVGNGSVSMVKSGVQIRIFGYYQRSIGRIGVLCWAV